MSEIFLVRHGQVALDGTGYDGLSTLGEEQAKTVGLALRERGVSPTRVVVGSMRRHHATADIASQAARWAADREVNPGWDEFDHVAILRAAGDLEPGDRSLSGPDTRRRFFEVAIPRWMSGLHDDDYTEPASAFTERVAGALGHVCSELSDQDTAVVFTSAGVIGRVVASLLEAGEKQWLTLIPVIVNSGVTRLRVTDDRTTLISYNEHSHVRAELLTYR